jgi:nicotinate dehydrogenase subunit B
LIMQEHGSTSRRGFLKTTGYLSLAFAIPLDNALSQADNTQPRLPGDLNNNRKLSAWLRINANQTVTLMVGKVELGQGILTAVTQVCADELDIDLSRVHVISGDTALVPNEGVTAGSFSMPNCATAVQYASAEVRAILLGLAAEKLNQPLAALSVRDGKITAQNGTHIAYWDLVLGAALERDATGLVKPKPAEQHRYIGQSVPRTDLPPKILGDAVFLQEHRPAGMVFGHLVRPPTYAAKLLSVNIDNAQTMPGVVKVVRNGSFLGVIAQREEQALAAAQVLSASAKWDVEKKLPTHEGIFDWLRNTKPNRIIETKVQPRAGGQAPAKTLAAIYYRPYQMHASIGTSAAIATMGSDGVMLIQTHSQSVFETSLAIAKMLGLPPNKVRAAMATTWPTMRQPMPHCWRWPCRASRCACNTHASKNTSGSPMVRPWSSKPKQAWMPTATYWIGTCKFGPPHMAHDPAESPATYSLRVI